MESRRLKDQGMYLTGVNIVCVVWSRLSVTESRLLCGNQSDSRRESGCSVWSCRRRLSQSGVAHPAVASVDCSLSFFIFYSLWKSLFRDFQTDAVCVYVCVCVPSPAWTPHHLALVEQGHLNVRQAAVFGYRLLVAKDNSRHNSVHTEERS